MKAVAITEFGGVEKLHLGDVPIPKITDNEVLIQVAYTAVNPVDWKIREGMFKGLLPHEFPLILGWDAAGKITAVGKNVKNFKVGDEVFAYCRKPVVKWGTYAEFVSFDAQHVALKPKNISFAQAAALPLVGLTAWQALFDHAELKKGDTILIHAGAGGVGSLAIELARNTGAKIYTTASVENHPYVKKLGANVPIDYHKDNFVKKIKSLEPKGLDVVLDCIGGESLAESYQLVKPGGKLVSIVEQVDQKLAADHKIKASFCFVAPNGKQLQKIADLFSKGKLEAPNIEEMNLSDAGKAQDKIRKGHTKGKIVLKVMR